MDSAENPSSRREIQSILKSIVRSSDEWLTRLKRRESRARLATSLLTALLVFWAVGAAFFAFVIGLYGWAFLSVLFHDRVLAYSAAGAIALVTLISGFTTYFLLRRKHDAQLKELSSLASEMRRIEVEGQKNGGGGEGIPDDAISLADKVMALLPEMVRKGGQDSLLLGLVAYIVVSVVGGNIVWAIPVGVAVWLVSRYEIRKRYEKEISKFEEQKRLFEQRKKDFIETL